MEMDYFSFPTRFPRPIIKIIVSILLSSYKTDHEILVNLFKAVELCSTADQYYKQYFSSYIAQIAYERLFNRFKYNIYLQEAITEYSDKKLMNYYDTLRYNRLL